MNKIIKKIVQVVLIATVLTVSDGIFLGNNTAFAKENIKEEISKVGYKVTPDEILNGTEVNIELKDVNLEGIIGVKYETDIPSLSNINVKDIKEGTFHIKVPQDTKSGHYMLKNGYTYNEEILQGAFKIEKKVNDLPNICINVQNKEIENEKPVIKIQGEDTIELEKGDLFKDPGYEVYDNIDKNVKVVITYTKNGQKVHKVDTSVPGEYKIYYNCEDNLGNKSDEVIRKVIVKNSISNEVVETKPLTRVLINTHDNVLKLKVGETFKSFGYNIPESQGINEDDYKYKISKGESAKISSKGLITAIKPGVSIINISYPGVEKPGIVIVQVIGEDEETSNIPEIKTSIDVSKYDTLYFTGKFRKYKFTVDISNGNDVQATVNDEKITKNEDGSYTAKLKDGYNIISVLVKNDKGSKKKFYVVRAAKLKINIKNTSRKEDKILQGDILKISFDGLQTPVPKMDKVYNPRMTMVEYNTNIKGIKSIQSKNSQYDINTINSIKIKVCDVGEYTLSNGHIHEAWWGEKLYGECRKIRTTPNIDADEIVGDFCSLPDININVLKNENYVEKRYFSKIEDSDNIFPGKEVVIHISDSLKELEYGSNIWKLNTVYNTDIKGLEEIKSSNAKNDGELLKTIKFVIPEDTVSGIYHITNGHIFKEAGAFEWFTREEELYKGRFLDITINVLDKNNSSKTDDNNKDDKSNIVLKAQGNKIFENGKDASIKVNVINKGNSSKKITLAIVLYDISDEYKTMINYVAIHKTLDKDIKDIFEGGFMIPKHGKYEIKIFPVDNMEDMNVLGEMQTISVISK